MRNNILFYSNSLSINLDYDQMNLTIKGNLCTEGGDEILNQVVSSLNEEIIKINEFSINFMISYQSSHHMKKLIEICKIFKMNKNDITNYKITWYYEDEEDAMYEVGLDLSVILKIPIKMKQI